MKRDAVGEVIRMESDLSLMHSYDWQDSWLMKMTLVSNELQLTVDARDIAASKSKGERVYRHIDIMISDIYKIVYDFNRKIIPDDDDISSIGAFSVKEIENYFDICFELDYGMLDVRAGAVKLNVL